MRHINDKKQQFIDCFPADINAADQAAVRDAQQLFVFAFAAASTLHRHRDVQIEKFRALMTKTQEQGLRSAASAEEPAET